MWISRDMPKTISGIMEKRNCLTEVSLFHKSRDLLGPQNTSSRPAETAPEKARANQSLPSCDSDSEVWMMLTGLPLKSRQKKTANPESP